ncbi:MAG: amino-acid N-acetyltransferase [Sandaracinaceae bacterium]
MSEEPPSPFVEGLRVAAPYIHRHRGKTFVVLMSGEAAGSEAAAQLLHDVALLWALGVRVVLIHGTRPQIEARLAEGGLPSRLVGETRITDREALRLVLEAVGALRARVEAHLSTGATHTPMAGARIRVAAGNFITAKPIGVRDGVDYGMTGEVRRVDVDGIRRRLDDGALVLISPVGVSPTGEAFNLQSQDLAHRVAVDLGAEKLVALAEQAPRDVDGAVLSTLSPPEVDELLADGGEHLGREVRWLLRAAAAAVRGGVPRAHIVERLKDGALLTELFSREGSGTLVTSETYEDLRPARLEDVAALARLLRPLEDAGVLVRRGRERLEVELDRFTVVERDGLVIGCAALDAFPSDRMGELYCVVMHPRYRHTGRGDALLAFMEDLARRRGLDALFVLTTHSAHFFHERGYEPAPVERLPEGRRATYDRRRRSRVLVKALAGSPAARP